MKKYILNENQLKKLIDDTLREQTEEVLGKKAVQCFLNKVLKSGLTVDGKHGNNTIAAIMKYQKAKGVYPQDGVWGEDTQSKMNENEIMIWKKCMKSANGSSLFDNLMNY